MPQDIVIKNQSSKKRYNNSNDKNDNTSSKAIWYMTLLYTKISRKLNDQTKSILLFLVYLKLTSNIHYVLVL